MINVKDLMSPELYTLKSTETVHQARLLMLSKKIGHVPIVDEQGEFVGLLTKRDILAISVSALVDIDTAVRDEIEASIPIAQVMITDVVVAPVTTNLLEAAQVMLEQKHGCLPIFEKNKLVGILTETDFVKLAILLMAESDKKAKTKASK